MIRIIPEWLQEAIDFLNQEFPEDKDVTITILYGYEGVSYGENKQGWASYDADKKSIYMNDFTKLKEKYNLYLNEAIDFTLMCLFHEYRHHQQNIYRLDMSEEDAERFAEQMKIKFMTRI